MNWSVGFDVWPAALRFCITRPPQSSADCSQTDVMAAGKACSEELDDALVSSVGRVQKGDDDVGIQRYSRHSPRNSSR